MKKNKLTVLEAARLTRTTKDNISKAIKRGSLKAAKRKGINGDYWEIDKASFETWRKELKEKTLRRFDNI